MNDLQRYALSGLTLFTAILILFWLDIWRARFDAAFHAAFPRRGRLTPLFFLLVLIEALLAGVFPPSLTLPMRGLVALGAVAASATVGALLGVCLRALPVHVPARHQR